LLEKEEADFAEQIRSQKSFLQTVFRDKEELAQVQNIFAPNLKDDLSFFLIIFLDVSHTK